MKGWRYLLLWSGLVAFYLGQIVTGALWPFAAAAPLGLAAMLLYTLLMRPVAQWSGGGRLPLTLIVLAVLAALLAGAGAGLAWLIGFPALPLWSGPLVTFAGIAAARLSGVAARSAEMDAFLDDAIAQIEGKTREIRAELDAAPERRGIDDLTDEDQATIRTALAQFAALPSDPPEAPAPPGWHESISGIIEPLEDKSLWLVALDELANADWRHLPNVEARALFALRPYVAASTLGQLDGHDAMLAALNAKVPRIAEAVAAEALQTMDLLPGLWREMPTPQALRQRADTVFAGTPAETPLRALADRVEALEAEDRAAVEESMRE